MTDVTHLPTPVLVEEDCCANCLYWLANDNGGLCRRNPPTCVVVGGTQIVGGGTNVITQGCFPPSMPSFLRIQSIMPKIMVPPSCRERLLSVKTSDWASTRPVAYARVERACPIKTHQRYR